MKKSLSSFSTRFFVIPALVLTLSGLSPMFANADADNSPVISSLYVTNVTSTGVIVNVISNEPVTIQLSYQNRLDTNSYSVQSSTLQTQHSISLNNLNTNTNFQVYAVAKNAYGRTAQSGTAYFSTAGSTNSDTGNPIVSNIRTQNIDNTEMTLMWDTNKPTTSVVWYHADLSDSSSVYSGGSYTAKSSNPLSTNHIVKIKNLQSGTRYRVMVGGTDSSGNVGQSEEQLLSTLSSSNPTPAPTSQNPGAPIVYNLSLALRNSKNNKGSRFNWKTNELSDSSVIYSTSADFTTNSRTAIRTALTRNHEINLGRLQSKTFYYYKVISKDRSGYSGVDTGVLYLP